MIFFVVLTAYSDLRLGEGENIVTIVETSELLWQSGVGKLSLLGLKRVINVLTRHKSTVGAYSPSQ